MTTLFASSNPIKLEEARQVFLDLEALELDAPEIQDTNPLAVVRHKLATVGTLGLEHPVIVEDTGLAIDAWGGLPGALVKWFVGRLGPDGLARISLGHNGEANGAQAVSAVGVYDRGESHTWVGTIRGRIVAPRGELGGWTPIFEVEGTGKTLAEMDLAERMTVTMRRRPLQEARTWLAARKEESRCAHSLDH